MQKETNVLLICLLILFAVVFSFWQTINLWFGEKVFLGDPAGGVILTALGLFTLLLFWINYVIIRRIIRKIMDN